MDMMLICIRILRLCDTKAKNNQCNYDLNDMVYMSDDVYIHKDLSKVIMR